MKGSYARRFLPLMDVALLMMGFFLLLLMSSAREKETQQQAEKASQAATGNPLLPMERVHYLEVTPTLQVRELTETGAVVSEIGAIAELNKNHFDFFRGDAADKVIFVFYPSGLAGGFQFTEAVRDRFLDLLDHPRVLLLPKGGR